MSQREYLIGLLEGARKRADQPLRFETKGGETRVRPASAEPGASFSFVDVFAGIGGLRLGLESVGGRCLWSCEWDKNAQKTYRAWFGELPVGDINEVNPKDIPDHDVLAAGFPCQPFSIAGVSKRKSLGRAHGFKDEAQGTLFFTLAGAIEQKKTPVLLLENVKNLKSHDSGRTWMVIRGTLEELGYEVHHRVIDAAGWVPQHRERVFIVALRRELFGNDICPDLASLEAHESERVRTVREILDPSVDARYTLTDHLWKYLRDYAAKHAAKGNGFGYGLADLDGVTRTLSARYCKDGSEILIPQRRRNPRRLTPREAARLMGFTGRFARMRGFADGEFPQVVSDTQAYRQFGNAVVPPVAEAVGGEVRRLIQARVFAQRPGETLRIFEKVR
jgi:DNA (cytosine-5)-methyltransferase 1